MFQALPGAVSSFYSTLPFPIGLNSPVKKHSLTCKCTCRVRVSVVGPLQVLLPPQRLVHSNSLPSSASVQRPAIENSFLKQNPLVELVVMLTLPKDVQLDIVDYVSSGASVCARD